MYRLKKLNDHITKLINDLTRKVKPISTKVLIKDLINKCNILNSFKYFSLDRSQNCLVFQPLSSCFGSKNGKNGSWQSKGMSEESIKPPSTTDNSFDLDAIFSYCQERIKFKRSKL